RSVVEGRGTECGADCRAIVDASIVAKSSAFLVAGIGDPGGHHRCRLQCAATDKKGGFQPPFIRVGGRKAPLLEKKRPREKPGPPHIQFLLVFGEGASGECWL